MKLDVTKKLTRFVSFSKEGKTEFYQVKYEKLPTFCNFCGMIGHWHEECGDGVHDEAKFEWGSFIFGPTSLSGFLARVHVQGWMRKV